MPRSAFNTLWAEDPEQFEAPSIGEIELGWEGGADKEPPQASYQNWWQNRVDSMLQEIERQGAPSWQSDGTYSVGALVWHASVFYMSRTNANTGNNPASSSANWFNIGASLGFVPVGGTILWYGSAASVPPGWGICDGTGGRPDMRDRVPVGAGSTYAVGAVGGAVTATSSTAGAHTHTALWAGSHAHAITVNNHTLTIAQIPPHTHQSNGTAGVGQGASGPSTVQQSAGTSTTSSAGSGQGHNHGASSAAAGDHQHGTDTQGGHSHTVDVRQPYRAWYFIMRTA
jgi:microcystin-dependent protein